MTGGVPPAGWYHDGRGLRWWDGGAWGPYAPIQPPVLSGTDPVLWATLVHLGFFVGGFVGPLAVRLTEGGKNEFVRHHSSEALNANLTILLVYLGAYGTGVTTSIVTNVPWPLLAGLGLTIVVVVLMLPQMVIGAVRASQGRWFRYPVNIRFVRGAVAPGEERPIVERRARTRPAGAAGPGKLPSPGHALRHGAIDVRRRARAWATVAVAMIALTVVPYFVAVGVNDLVFGYDVWNDVAPSDTAEAFAVVSIIVGFLIAFGALAIGWGWMAALATDPTAGARTALRRGTGVALRRVWYTAPAMAVTAAVCATALGAPLVVAVLAPVAFG